MLVNAQFNNLDEAPRWKTQVFQNGMLCQWVNSFQTFKGDAILQNAGSYLSGNTAVKNFRSCKL